METRNDITQELQLYGEQMSLKSRDSSEKNKLLNRSRPKSALYSTDAMTHVQKRRPLSAGTDPRSPKFNSFLRTPKRNESINNLYTSRNTPLIPGSAESSVLLDKLIQDPLTSTSHFDYNISDDISDISSIENTFETPSKSKISNERNTTEEKAAGLKANAIKLKKYRSPSIEKLIQNYNTEPPLQDELNKTAVKLKICVPNAKDENTSSGVSSSSEVHNPSFRFTPPRLLESSPGSKILVNKNPIDWSPSNLNDHHYDKIGWDLETNRSKDLTGRVSFGNKHFEKSPEPNNYVLSQDFNPELSLVEEESSQESDENGSFHVKFRLNNDENNCNGENAIEKKFKELQQKYKFEEMNITKKHSSYISNIDDKSRRKSDLNYSSPDTNDKIDFISRAKSHLLEQDQIIPEKLSVPKITVNEYTEEDKYKSPSKSKNGDKYYPKYLDDENKSYTSKVLEEYRKEIASIDDSHELALRDLRNTYSNDGTKQFPNDNSTINESPISNDSQQPPYNNLSDNDADGLSKEMSELSHDIDQNTLRRPKVKRRIKKKEKKTLSKETVVTNHTHTTNTLKKSSNYRIRSLKSAPVRRNSQSSKFKQHKITLSKSTTNINQTSYLDYDNGVESWMATHISSPENSFFNNKGENSSINSEKEIKPIINSKRSINADSNNSANESSMVTSNHSLREIPKLKEVSFKDDYYESDIENELSHWHRDQHDRHLNGLLENSSIVADIHSSLNEIKPPTPYKQQDYEEQASPEYKDIMDFLEHVENSANREISTLSHTQPIFALKIEELMELSKAELAHKAVASALSAGKASETAAKLRAALSDAVKRTGIKLQEAKQSARQKISNATQQSAIAIARHQKFIEQLISEKKALSERIEQLVSAAAAAETRRVRAASAATERLQLELKNQRQRLSVAHHRDKQAWLKQHTQKIKEMTVKSLESEIKEMEERHTSQTSLLKKENEDTLISEREKHIREIRMLKERMAQAMEDELDKERMLAAERLEKKRLEWESALENAAERAANEQREATRRAEDNARAARKEAEVWLNQKEKEMNKKMLEFERKFEEKKESLTSEIIQIKERLNDEYESYKGELVKKQNENFKTREMELKSMMRRERDREIEKVIDSMEMESQKHKNDMQENIRQLKDKYERDIKLLEDSEKTMLQKSKNLHEQLKDMQECYSSQQITVTQLEGKIKQLEELRSQAEKQTDISVRLAESKSREKCNDLQDQMKNLHQQHKDEMHQLYAKVKLAVSKKDNALTAARREASTLRERCVRLEARNN